MALTKKGMAASISENTNIIKKDCQHLVDSVFEIIKAELEKGNNVAISGFGKWAVRVKYPRRGRNPRTGEPITITGRQVVTFKCSPVLKKSFQSEE